MFDYLTFRFLAEIAVPRFLQFLFGMNKKLENVPHEFTLQRNGTCRTAAFRFEVNKQGFSFFRSDWGVRSVAYSLEQAHQPAFVAFVASQPARNNEPIKIDPNN